MPAITIVVPVYNGEGFLARCVDSLLAQTFDDIELILVNDGSTDSSAAICDAYARKDERIRVIHKTNEGVAGARNAGVEAAAGDYIGFCDCDDYVMPHMYSTLMDFARKKNADAVKCGLILVAEADMTPPYPKTEAEVKTVYNRFSYNEEFVPKAQFFERCLLKTMEVSVCNILVRAKICKRVKFWRRYAEDHRFQAELMAHIDGYETLPAHGYLYIQNPASRLHSLTTWDRIEFAYADMLLFEEMGDILSEYAKQMLLLRCRSMFYRNFTAVDRRDVEKLRDLLRLSEFLVQHNE
ncbi:MAG: glycosyltransferase [Oscillospiraceae bacterium]|nr:glycosyltransferase [Oscillospiraceae bacterium]